MAQLIEGPRIVETDVEPLLLNQGQQHLLLHTRESTIISSFTRAHCKAGGQPSRAVISPRGGWRGVKITRVHSSRGVSTIDIGQHHAAHARRAASRNQCTGPQRRSFDSHTLSIADAILFIWICSSCFSFPLTTHLVSFAQFVSKECNSLHAFVT